MKLFPLYHASWLPESIADSGGILSTCPLGLPMSQNRLAVPTWSYAMERFPPARIIELGTAGGGFITAIAVHAHMIGAKVVTFDRSPPDARLVPLARFLGVDFRTTDIWQAAPEILLMIRQPGVTYVLCDGGDKKRELALFAQALKPGDVIAAHDYDASHELDPMIPAADRPWPWGEIGQKHGEPVAAAAGLAPFLQEHFDLAGWLAYRKPVASSP